MTTETKKQVTATEFTEKVNAGMKRSELAEYYGLPETNIAAILKQLGLTIKKTQTPKYVLIDDRPKAESNNLPDYTSEEPTSERIN
jgi:hypothetical protein